MQEPAPPVASLLDFRGKTVVVTGASAGIGAGIARRCSEAGANVVINYRSDRAGAVTPREASNVEYLWIPTSYR